MGAGVNETLANSVMDYLTSHRTASAGNVATHCGCAVEDLRPVVEMLESQQRLRPAFSRCQSSCSTCAGCDSGAVSTALTERTVLISLERTEETP